MLAVILVISLIVLAVIMYRAADYLVTGIKEAGGSHVGTFLLASIFTGVATSIPELFVGASAAISGNSALGFANALGSNSANIGLVLPLAVLASGLVVKVNRTGFSPRTTLLLLTAALFPFLFGLDGEISRIDGMLLIFLFVVYGIYLFSKRPEGLFGYKNLFAKVRTWLHRPQLLQGWTLIGISILILTVSSMVMVRSGIVLASLIGVTPFLVGLFLLAPGTALPELVLAMVAARRRDVDVLYGDLYGSLITNANLVVGVIAVIRPIVIAQTPHYMVALLFLPLLYWASIAFTKSAGRLEKWEATGLIALYVLFFSLETLL